MDFPKSDSVHLPHSLGNQPMSHDNLKPIRFHLPEGDFDLEDEPVFAERVRDRSGLGSSTPNS
jgi:hypothetical protein